MTRSYTLKVIHRQDDDSILKHNSIFITVNALNNEAAFFQVERYTVYMVAVSVNDSIEIELVYMQSR